MRKVLQTTSICLLLSLSWLSRAASQPTEISFSCFGVLDYYDEGWAKIQTDCGSEWLLPIGNHNLTEGGVFRIKILLSPDEQVYREQMAKASQLLLALLD